MNEQDRELAPMVDGLSSGLCMLILIATVFMISAISVNVANIQGSIQFTKSELDINNSLIYLHEGINLTQAEYQQISAQIKNSPGNTINIYGYYRGDNISDDQKLIYNFVVFKQGVKTDKEINFVKGDSKMCKGRHACIHWEVR